MSLKNIKKPTKKEIVKEIILCARDPIYFLLEYGRIEHPKEGIIDFKLFDYQKDIIKGMLENRFNIVLKARQLGVTTIVAGFIAWFILFHKHTNVIAIATKQEKAKIVLRVVKNIIRYLPPWMVPGMVKIDIDNRTSIELSNRI